MSSIGPERLFQPGLLQERTSARRQGLDNPLRHGVGLGTTRDRRRMGEEHAPSRATLLGRSVSVYATPPPAT
eukprot:9761894-Alexandrium_andersonii.AAC.1